MTAICVLRHRGLGQAAERLDLAQVVALLVFAAVALVAGHAGDSPLGCDRPRRSTWLNPFGDGGAALTGGLLLGVFAYWGWESAVNLTEETEDSATAPGQGRDLVDGDPAGHLRRGGRSRSSPTPAPSSSPTTPARRSSIFALLATEVHGRLGLGGDCRGGHVGDRLDADHDHPRLAHRRCRWPVGTRCPRRFGQHPPAATARPTSAPGGSPAIAIVWYLGHHLISENALFDSLTALSLLIAFYYALTGIACAVYYRRHLSESVKNLLLIGVGPVVGVGAADLAARASRSGTWPTRRTPTAGSRGSASARRW